ncbi:MAG: pyridoxine 5'-phosphate synthase [Flavobacteriia bacterium]|nr:pyridoxine 5'-phosphate synthase [Flavobacteriia bacterium]
MTHLSVNVNKVATLRNARGGNVPNVLQTALDCERFGAQGITVHPRPDERHIRYADVRDLAPAVTTEFNIEGYPNESFIQLVLENKPAQVTLVPDGPDVLTSNAGWDTVTHADLLRPIISKFKEAGIRVSLFIETDEVLIQGAADVGADRVELYTEAFAVNHAKLGAEAAKPYADSARFAHSIGLGVNAGHDLSLDNLADFVAHVPHLDEVSIGHALISDALYLGLENTVQAYRRQIELGWNRREH